MKKDDVLNIQDISYFYDVMKDVKKIKQDTVFHEKPYKNKKKYCEKRNYCNKDAHIKFFNSNTSTRIIQKNPVSYIRDKCLKSELQKLKNNIYSPKVCLDLHGLTRYQAQQELGQLFVNYYIKKTFCFGVIHGHGKNILKHCLPIWLSKHPDVLAFYQSPKIFGRNTTLFVLIDYKK